MSRVAGAAGRSTKQRRCQAICLEPGSLDLLAAPATRDKSQGQDNYKTTTRQLQDNQMMLPEATLLVLGA